MQFVLVCSTTTMKMGIERRLKERIPEIQEVEQIMDTETVQPPQLRNPFRITPHCQPPRVSSVCVLGRCQRRP